MKNKILTIILVVIVLLLGGYIIYDKTNSNDVKITKKVEDVKEVDDKKENLDKITKLEIIDLYKNYVMNSKDNLIDANNIDKWNVDKVVYHGYYNDEPDVKYYTLSISYSCKDSTNNCLYKEVSDTNNSFELEVSIDKNNIFKLSGETIENENFKVVNSEM